MAGIEDLLRPGRFALQSVGQKIGPHLRDGSITSPGVLGGLGANIIPQALHGFMQYYNTPSLLHPQFLSGLGQLWDNVTNLNWDAIKAPWSNRMYRPDVPQALDDQTLRELQQKEWEEGVRLWEQQKWEEYLKQWDELELAPSDPDSFLWENERRWRGA